MKLLTLLSLFVSITINGISQINKGQFLIGGSISFESIKTEGTNAADYKTTNIFVSPNIGYFIINNMAGGLRFDFRSYKQKAPDLTQTYISISPFLRYYFLKPAKKLNVFIDAGYINYTSKYKSSQGASYDIKTNGYTISAGPSIFLTNQVALEFTVGYKRTRADDSYSTISTLINSAIGLQIHFGKAKSASKK